MTQPLSHEDVNAVLGIDDQTAAIEYVSEQVAAAFQEIMQRWEKEWENELLYGNPHGPVHGPTPRGIMDAEELRDGGDLPPQAP